MKTKIFSSLIAMLLLSFCVNAAFAQDKTVYDHVSMETPPSYPGGIKNFYEELGKNITYPKTAVENKVQGTVYISFIIEKDGSLSDVETAGRKLGAGLDEEAIRVLKLSKKWNPGLQNGKVVRVKYNIPIKFTLPKKAN